MLTEAENQRFGAKNGYYQSEKYFVSWCVGHLIALDEPTTYGWEWSLDQLPMIPEKWKYHVVPRVKKQFNVVKALMAKSNEIINGTDAGREGELIYRLVVLKAGANKKPQFRLWANDMVIESLVKSWRNLEPASNFNNLYAAANVRQKADWLVGMNLSRGYSLGTGIRGLSVGRVQTPTLALIVQRDAEILNWKQKFYKEVECLWNGLKLKLVNDEGETAYEENDPTLAATANELLGAIGTAKKVLERKKQTKAPKLFDLLDLQKEGNNKHGFTAQQTLSLAQGLYEKKLISYPRTDSNYLTDEMLSETYGLLNQIASQEQKGSLYSEEKISVFNNKKVTDHYAIIPTTETPQRLGDKEKKIYEIVLKRFVQAFGKPHIYLSTDIIVAAAGHKLKANFRKDIDKGWKALFNEKSTEEGQSTSRKIAEGDRASIKEAKVLTKEVTKPAHYTESTLLTAMKTCGRNVDDKELATALRQTEGLGTPATRASIIEILKKREYINTVGKKLIATERGNSLIALVDDKVKSAEFTGMWEARLKKIEAGEYSWKKFMAEIEDYVKGLTAGFESLDASGLSGLQKKQDKPIKCPKCSQITMKIKKPAAFCDNESCKTTVWRKQFGKSLSDSQLNSLVLKGITGKLSLKSKAGQKYSAQVKLNNEMSGELVFANKK